MKIDVSMYKVEFEDCVPPKSLSKGRPRGANCKDVGMILRAMQLHNDAGLPRWSAAKRSVREYLKNTGASDNVIANAERRVHRNAFKQR